MRRDEIGFHGGDRPRSDKSIPPKKSLLKGRHRGAAPGRPTTWRGARRDSCKALTGQGPSLLSPFPGALPRAFLCRPFRAKDVGLLATLRVSVASPGRERRNIKRAQSRGMAVEPLADPRTASLDRGSEGG